MLKGGDLREDLNSEVVSMPLEFYSVKFSAYFDI